MKAPLLITDKDISHLLHSEQNICRQIQETLIERSSTQQIRVNTIFKQKILTAGLHLQP